MLGLEDFENSIDKISSGNGDDEPSWIQKIFYKYREYVNPFEDDEVVLELDGLEPPMLDETWGIRYETNDAHTNFAVVDNSFGNQLKGIYNKTSINCKTKMWRCVARVAEGGLDYFHRPEGISG